MFSPNSCYVTYSLFLLNTLRCSTVPLRKVNRFKLGQIPKTIIICDIYHFVSYTPFFGAVPSFVIKNRPLSIHFHWLDLF